MMFLRETLFRSGRVVTWLGQEVNTCKQQRRELISKVLVWIQKVGCKKKNDTFNTLKQFYESKKGDFALIGSENCRCCLFLN